MRRPPPPLVIGPLPVKVINDTIDTELDPGDLVLSRGAQTHAARKHPKDFARLVPHLGAVVTNPLYIGDDHRNGGKIELIGKPPGESSFLLVAVIVERDDRGQYHVASFYPVSDGKVQSRRRKGFLRVAQKHKAPIVGALAGKFGK